MPTEVRFIADAMLGKLATWLRLLGCDVEYFPRMADDDLAERAARSGRVLLTRDTGLIRRRKVRENHFFVRGDAFRDQLRQVAERFTIDPSGRILSRCLRCNETLAPIGRSDARNRVPPYVYETQPSFSTCARCGRVYWRGTHRDKAMAEIREILGRKERPG